MIPPIVQNFWDKSVIHQIKNEIIEEGSRENPEEKVKDFFKKADDIIYALEHQQKIAQVKRIPLIGYILYILLSN